MDIKHVLNVILTTLTAVETGTIAVAIFTILRQRRVGHREMLKNMGFFNAAFAIQTAIVAIDLGSRSFGWGLTSFRVITVAIGFKCVLALVHGLPDVEHTLDETEFADQIRHEKAFNKECADDLLITQSDMTLEAGRKHLHTLTGQVDGAR